VLAYLKAFDAVDNDASTALNAITFPDTVTTAADLLAWNASITKMLTAVDGAISRFSTVQPTALEPATDTHLKQAIAAYQSLRTALKALQDAVAAGNSADILQKADDLNAVEAAGSAQNRTTEQLLLQYNITDTDANYLSRGY
jgi:hypothetical protein